MPLFKREAATTPRSSPANGDAPPNVPEAFLRSLDDEIWRARRYERPLSVVAATPRLLPSEKLSPAEADLASTTVREILRRSDDAAWFDDASIVGVLPETDGDQARAAAYRLRSELERRSVVTRRINWRAAAVALDGEEFGRDLIDALFAELAADLT